MVQRELRPDLTLLLDAPIDVAMERARRRNTDSGQVSDRFEREQSEFFTRVRAEYLRIAQAEPQRVSVIDAAQPLQTVERAVLERIAAFIRKVRV